MIAGFPVFLIIGVFALTFIGIIPPKNKESSSYLPIIAAFSIGSTILFFIWFVCLKLKTTISNEGIRVNYLGIPFCKKYIKWEDIQSISVIKYAPISDYGGWGVRYSLTGNGWCYNVAGDYGIKLIRSNGKPFLIGTQQKEEAEKIINLYFKK